MIINSYKELLYVNKYLENNHKNSSYHIVWDIEEENDLLIKEKLENGFWLVSFYALFSLLIVLAKMTQ